MSHFLCQSYQRLKFDRNPCRVGPVFSEGWKWRELVWFSLNAILTWRYPLGLAPLSVFHKGTPHLSLLKNGPEAENWIVAQEGKERTLLLGFSASGPAAGTVGPLARGDDHIWKGSCYWQLPIMSFGNQFLLQPDHTSIFPCCCHPIFLAPITYWWLEV